MNIIKNLEVFKVVAETESFTKAAELTKLPRSTVSTLIKQLEKRLATRLFYRTTRSVNLTENGIILLTRCRHLLFEIEEIERLFLHSSQNAKGKLKINAPSRIAAKLISPALSDFFAKYPDITLEMGATDRLVDVVEEGFDCVIRVGELASSNLIAKKLGNFELIICASPEYIKQNGLPLQPEDLKNHWIVDYLPSGTKRESVWELYQGNKKITVEMQSKIGVNHVESYIECAQSGLGLIQVPAFDVKALIDAGKLVQVLSEYTLASLPVYALYPHREYVPKTVRAFIEWIETVLKSKLQN